MAIAGAKAGQKMFVERATTIPAPGGKMKVVDANTGKIKTVTRVPKPVDVKGEMDIMQTKIEGSTQNRVNIEAYSKLKMSGKPNEDVNLKGDALQVPGEEVSLSRGTGTMKWSETIKGVTRNFVKEFNWSGEGGQNIREIGTTKIYEVTSRGEPIAYTGQGPGTTIVPTDVPTLGRGKIGRAHV